MTLFYLTGELLKICGHVIVKKIKTNRKITRPQISQSASAGKGANISGL